MSAVSTGREQRQTRIAWPATGVCCPLSLARSGTLTSHMSRLSARSPSVRGRDRGRSVPRLAAEEADAATRHRRPHDAARRPIRGVKLRGA
jgi:hypothetical protein